jgi:uncharacterized protein YdeI (YjbR/CyaY-like superfamily)
MTVGNPNIEAFIDGATLWQEEMEELRDLLLDCGLTEELKWGKPCYTARGSNIVIMQPFKAHLSLMFFKGALLDDPEGILSPVGGNTQAALRVELTSREQVVERGPVIRSYIREAIAADEAGLDVPKKTAWQYGMPAELERRLEDDEDYREAFEALTPGRFVVRGRTGTGRGGGEPIRRITWQFSREAGPRSRGSP